ncbi:MAG: hypothetical protein PVF47_04970 [Anaerolineae bacterium]|jgi:hypothetical protein
MEKNLTLRERGPAGLDEPRGWALCWEVAALPGFHDSVSTNGNGDGNGYGPGTWAPDWTLIRPESLTEPWPLNGDGPSRFGEPRGWANGWEGQGLADVPRGNA